MEKVSSLRIAAALNFLLAIGHILCIPWLDTAFRLYGIDGLMIQIASHGIYIPYIITLAIATFFALCGVYALSADGIIRKLPFLWTGVFTIAIVFLFRAGIGCFWMLSNSHYPITDLSSVAISGCIGSLYLIGGICEMKNK